MFRTTAFQISFPKNGNFLKFQKSPTKKKEKNISFPFDFKNKCVSAFIPKITIFRKYNKKKHSLLRIPFTKSFFLLLYLIFCHMLVLLFYFYINRNIRSFRKAVNTFMEQEIIFYNKFIFT